MKSILTVFLYRKILIFTPIIFIFSKVLDVCSMSLSPKNYPNPFIVIKVTTRYKFLEIYLCSYKNHYSFKNCIFIYSPIALIFREALDVCSMRLTTKNYRKTVKIVKVKARCKFVGISL